MDIALIMVVLIAVAGSCVFVYLTGRDRDGWAAKLNTERAAQDAQERELVGRIERLTSELAAHAQNATEREREIHSQQAYIDQLLARALSAEGVCQQLQAKINGR